MARWLAETFSSYSLQPLNESQRNLTGSKISPPSTKTWSLCFLGRSENQNDRPCLWLEETFSDSSLESLSEIWRNLTRSKILTTSTNFCFRTYRKTKMAAQASDWLRHFRLYLCNRWMEFNKTWQEARSQRFLQSLCFFGPIRKPRWPPWAADWLRHFRLILFNHWTEFNETWQEVKSHRPLPRLEVCVFWADRKTKMTALASDWKRHFRILLWNHWAKYDETWQEARF